MRSLSALGTLGAASLVAAQTAFSPPVKVSLTTSWAAPPILLEILETTAAEHPGRYFEILDALIDRSSDGLLGPITEPVHKPKYVYSTALAHLITRGFLTEPNALSAFEKNMALHSATPKIQAFYQLFGDPSKAPECQSWIEWSGKQACTSEEADALLAGASNGGYTQIFPFDHVQESTSGECTSHAIFYASLSSPNFYDLYSHLRSKSETPGFCYILRYSPPKDTLITGEQSRNILSGYGVALDLKKMDYLALDDRGPRGKDEDSDSTTNESIVWEDYVSSLLSEHPHEDLDLTAPLTEEEISSLPLRATHLVMSSEDPLKALSHLSQNFPKHVVSVARRWDPARTEDLKAKHGSVEAEVQANMHMVSGAGNMFWLNGVALPEADINPFRCAYTSLWLPNSSLICAFICSLLRLLRREHQTVNSLMNANLTPEQAIHVLTNPEIGKASVASGPTDGVFDASDREEGGGAIIWLNDIEKDKRYTRWPSSLTVLFRPMYPGQFPTLRRNCFNVIAALDLSRTSSISFVVQLANNLISRMLPFRFGYVPLIETAESRQIARLMKWMMDEYGFEKTAQYFSVAITPSDTVDLKLLETAYVQYTTQMPPQSGNVPEFSSFSADPLQIQVVGHQFVPDEELQPAAAYAKRLRLGAQDGSGKGHVFINGKHFAYDDVSRVNFFQEQLYAGTLVDAPETDVSVFMYDLPTTAKRRNKFIYPSGNLRVYALDNLFHSVGATKLLKDSFVYPAGGHPVPLTISVVGDMDNEETLNLAIEGLRGMSDDAKYRLGFIHTPTVNPSDLPSTQQPLVSPMLARLAATGNYAEFPPSELAQILEEAKQLVVNAAELNVQDNPVLLNLNNRLTGITNEGVDYEELKRTNAAGNALAKAIGLKNGERALVINGRVIGPLAGSDFVAEDFGSLANYEAAKRVTPVVTALNAVREDLTELDRPAYADLIARVSSIISSVSVPDPSEEGLFQSKSLARQRPYNELIGKDCSSTFEIGDNSTALFHVGLLLDPLSEPAQKWSSIVEWLATVPQTHIHVRLNPAAALTEIPLKRFYRYNIQPRLTFDQDGFEMRNLVEFHGLPVEPIYTLAMDVNPAWLVRPYISEADLDNIHLASLSDPKAGVEAIFHLDHLVIEGHAREENNAPPRGVQLQLTSLDGNPTADTQVVANLGYFQFRTGPGAFRLEIRPGRGRDVYTIESAGNEGWNSGHVNATGTEITLTSFEGHTIYPRLNRKPGMESADVLAEPEKEESIWSRSLWGSKPTDVVSESKQADINIFTVASGLLYEEFIPHLAEKYGFQYELVTYKWPSWLRAQKEKQRVIWAYKILFLDVLFPMDLKKVIFVDADQIVRTDLKELVDLDLQGAPYGYTPMGDDNEAMEGFRFWKQGYWKDALRGKPYHIRLRGQYQALSADPNSLANLDQGDSARFDRAKTIDLCQNPLTKEPKLARARQIPEWTSYDNEIAEFARSLVDSGKIRSRAISGSVDALASVGKKVTTSTTEESPVPTQNEEAESHREHEEL
ncbi:UDP-glucose:glycoprotein glucosyltransferase, putative [Rhizoctonia solani AG-1 IA]|uniref:UDP-glucose:glycoprotein glucosyltransferase, putative n=1 Tax=Thanatephorus cucumeris (strain AG1-IA) TaxID=983506 RepID=L8WXY6_THACA|nr:UDP-glucose:glycoprotein glucosyltransferase, putative [Rhizoctonia solani AG-1 IA]